MAISLVVAPCRLLEVREVLGASIIISRILEAASASESWDKSYQNTRRNNSEDSQLHIQLCTFHRQKIFVTDILSNYFLD
jgi:hypothetical protein